MRISLFCVSVYVCALFAACQPANVSQPSGASSGAPVVQAQVGDSGIEPDVEAFFDDPQRQDSQADDIQADDVQAEHIQADVKFSDVLEQYQALNSRLENIAARLQIANVALCPRTTRDLGFTVHTVSDYPESLQAIAAAMLGVSERLSIRTVRAGSPADLAGVRVGDKIVQVHGAYLPSGDSAGLMYRALLKRATQSDAAQLRLRREGEVLSFAVNFETLCGYPAIVFFSEDVNGHTDGEAVWITSELMRQTPDDNSLALVVAHEMAHAIAGHLDRAPTQALELEADRMALVLMARAGFDISRAIAFWKDSPHPHADLQDRSDTHPTIAQRLDNFQVANQYIERAKRQKKPLELYP